MTTDSFYADGMTITSTDIRLATAADAADITRVHDLAWRNAYRGIIPGLALEKMISRRGEQWWERNIRRGGAVFVLEVCGVVAGYVSVGRSRMKRLSYSGEIFELYVHPDYQGLGFGKKLLEAGKAILRRNNLDDIAVRVLSDNERAGAFYGSCGGRLVARSHETVDQSKLGVSVYAWMADQ